MRHQPRPLRNDKRIKLHNGCYVLFNRYAVELEYRLYSADGSLIGTYDSLTAAELAVVDAE